MKSSAPFRTRFAERAIGFAALLVVIFAGVQAYRYAWPKLTLLEPTHAARHFRQMDRAFPSRLIARSDAPLPLPDAPRALEVRYEFGGETRSLAGFLERSETTAFLVVHRDRVVVERYFKGYGKDDLATSFSVAKSFLSTLVGIALDEGLIDSVDDPITRYVPELIGSGFEGVPIAAILQMSSGVDFTEDYQDRRSDAFTIYNKMFLAMRSIRGITADVGRGAAPGRAFHYASINSQALGMLLTAVTGKSVSALMEENLWGPMGAGADAKWLLDMHGNEIAFWGLNARPRDFARLGLLYLHGGVVNGRQIVSADWIARATTPDKPYLQPGQIDGDWGYQYQWWVPKREDSAFASGDYTAIGVYGQFIYVNPEAALVIVKTSADIDGFKPHEYEAVQAFRAIARALQE